MYPEKDRTVENLVQDMIDLPIQHVGKLNDFISFE